MNVINVKNARYTEAGLIDCDVLFEGAGDYIPFTAMPDDPEEHGKKLFESLVAGEWGEIAPFTVTQEMLALAKASKKQEIIRWREEQERASDTFGFGGRRWDAGRASLERLVLAAAQAKFGRLPEGFTWSDADNIQVQLTERRVLALVTAMLKFSVQREAEVFRRQREMKDELEKLNDLKLIREFDVK